MLGQPDEGAGVRRSGSACCMAGQGMIVSTSKVIKDTASRSVWRMVSALLYASFCHVFCKLAPVCKDYASVPAAACAWDCQAVL